MSFSICKYRYLCAKCKIFIRKSRLRAMSSTPYRIEPLHIGYIGALVEDPLGDIPRGGESVAVALLLFPMICNKATQEIATSLTALAMTPRKSVILNEVKNLVIGAIVFLPSLLSADPSTTLRSAQDDKERARAHCGSAQRPTRGYNHVGEGGEERCSFVFLPKRTNERYDSLFSISITEEWLLYPNSSAIWR